MADSAHGAGLRPVAQPAPSSRRCPRLGSAGRIGRGLVAVPSAGAALLPIKHVFVIVLENESESESTTFGPGAPAPYLAKTLPSMGVFVPNYYAVGHHSLDNYIAMISGQAPNPATEADCHTHWDAFEQTSTGAYEQAIGEGCVYPSGVKTLPEQLEESTEGYTWKGYMQNMPRACAHPAALGDEDTEQGAVPGHRYATRHDPFMWFQSITGPSHEASCKEHVVALEPALEEDLASTEKTPNFSFITPDTCYDGHESSCSGAPEEPAGYAGINSFLSTWVHKITESAAFKESGLLVVTFDEADAGDASACCGETTSGGGDIGAVMVSPDIRPGTESTMPYNHYSLLGSIEHIFGLPLLGDAQEPGTTFFGTDIYNIDNPIVTTTTTSTTTTSSAAAPLLTGLRQSAAKWRERKSKAKKPPVGTTVSFDLNEAASVSFAFDKTAKGRKVGKACVTQTKKNRHKPRCTRSTPVGTLNLPAHAGANTVSFDGMLSTPSKLPPGSYTVTVTAAASGLHSAPQTLHFTIVKG